MIIRYGSSKINENKSVHSRRFFGNLQKQDVQQAVSVFDAEFDGRRSSHGQPDRGIRGGHRVISPKYCRGVPPCEYVKSGDFGRRLVSMFSGSPDFR